LIQLCVTDLFYWIYVTLDLLVYKDYDSVSVLTLLLVLDVFHSTNQYLM